MADVLEAVRTSKTLLNTLEVRPIENGERDRWDRLMANHHYLGKRLVGETLRYVALLEGQWAALLGWSSAAFKSRFRDEWIGWTEQQRWQRLKYLANNSRFLILPGIHVQNMASKALALNLKRLAKDWQTRYNHPVVLAETFVDPDFFPGTCYKAAGWSKLGSTRGYGRSAGRYYKHGSYKLIFVYPLHREVKRLLSASFLGPELCPESLMDISNLDVDGLRAALGAMQDPRKLRGIRYRHETVLAIGIYAWLSGAKSYLTMGKWAKQLTQQQLKMFGCRLHEDKRCYIPPSEATLRRAMACVDPGELSRVVTRWLEVQGKELPADSPPWRPALFVKGGRR
ncbi:MAG: DUF4338 domain-containing protein [Firmicutes bacterium]|nr:DUF4338 domain-containing protein [Bacillota bacterium]